MNYRVAKNRRKHRTHRPEKPKPPEQVVDEPMVTCYPSGRIMPLSEYARLYQEELIARDAHWHERNAASPYHPRLS